VDVEGRAELVESVRRDNRVNEWMGCISACCVDRVKVVRK
jgi:hypothetical protein